MLRDILNCLVDYKGNPSTEYIEAHFILSLQRKVKQKNNVMSMMFLKKRRRIFLLFNNSENIEEAPGW